MGTPTSHFTLNVGLAVLVAVACPSPVGAATATSKPTVVTVVLVHGAFAESSSWSGAVPASHPAVVAEMIEDAAEASNQ